MENFHWESIAGFVLLSITTFYQQLHAKHFDGASVKIGFWLSIFGFLGLALQLGYLGYYAWNVSWWAAIVVFFMGILTAVFIGGILEKIVGAVVLCLAGFLALPICAYFMFTKLP